MKLSIDFDFDYSDFGASSLELLEELCRLCEPFLLFWLLELLREWEFEVDCLTLMDTCFYFLTGVMELRFSFSDGFTASFLSTTNGYIKLTLEF